jgi:endonuclease/exonuclease/phosphatase family metal-dependent hydrolase
MLAQPSQYLERMPLVRVATFNIRHGLGTDGRVDLERTAATMLASKAELVALQEIDRGLDRSGRVDQARELARLTGMEVDFRPTISRGPGHYGLGLATTERVEAWFRPLPTLRPEDEPRGVVLTRWRSVTVLATHLSRSAGTRAAQTEALARMAAAAEAPVLVMGDLNQGRDGLTPLLRVGFDAGAARHTTLRTALGRGIHIDHVACGTGLRLLRTWTIDTEASDHRLLAAEIELP